MINNVQSLKDKLRNVAKEKNVDFNVAMRFYMYDCFIKRLSQSHFKENFILKGGFYLSTLFGIDTRSTMDIDTAIMNLNLTKENLRDIFNEIIKIDVQDNVKFQIEKLEHIRDENEYGGLRVTIEFKFETLHDRFHIDIATGDPIYPEPYDYNYNSIIEHDIYLINKFTFKEIDKSNFRKAIEMTFAYRNFNNNIYECFMIIEDSHLLQMRWSAYVRKNKYARGISFQDTISCLKNYIDILLPVYINEK